MSGINYVNYGQLFTDEAGLQELDELQLEDMPNISEHFDLKSHNGVITVENTNKGTHRTFRIKTQKDTDTFKPGVRIISILTGPDNTRDYTQIGEIRRNGSVKLWRRHDTPLMRSLMKVLQFPAHYRELGCEFHIEGRCRKCNRVLSTPDSIRSGIGPKCAGRQS